MLIFIVYYKKLNTRIYIFYTYGNYIFIVEKKQSIYIQSMAVVLNQFVCPLYPRLFNNNKKKYSSRVPYTRFYDNLFIIIIVFITKNIFVIFAFLYPVFYDYDHDFYWGIGWCHIARTSHQTNKSFIDDSRLTNRSSSKLEI